MDALLLITVIFGLGLAMIFGGYGIILVLSNLFKKLPRYETSESTTLPHISVIIPTYNEKEVIESKIKNLLDTDYPLEKIEFIFVDNSTDETPDIIKRWQKRHSQIKLIHSPERLGYNRAVLTGIREANGKVIVLTDGGSFYDSQTLVNIVKPFENPKIGVVTGRGIIINKDESMGSTEILYKKMFNFMRKSESKLDSTPFIHGEACAVRSEIAKNLPFVPANLDISLAFAAKKSGKRAIYVPDIKFYEYAPEKFKERITQKKIRAFGVMRVYWSYKYMFLNPKYGLFGLVTYPAHFMMFFVAPILLLLYSLSIIGILVSWLMASSTNTLIIMTVLVIIIIIVIIIYQPVKSFVLNIIQLEYSLLWGMYKCITSFDAKDTIETVKSTRKPIEAINETIQ